MEYILFAGVWIIWCTLHSALISISVTDYLKRKLGVGFRFYRLFFNVFALGTIIPLFIWQPSEPLFQWGGYWLIGQLILFLIGGFLMLAGGMRYDMLHLLGIRQVKEGIPNTLMSDDGDMDRSGILGIIRHPWYLAGFILIWGANIGVAEIIRNVILDSYLIAGAYLEERKLVAELGEKYRAYQRQVPMFLPSKWTKR